MKIVLDTNVFVSGVFFSGPPAVILNAWQAGHMALLLSPEILEECRRVGEELARRSPAVALTPVMEWLKAHVPLIEAPPLRRRLCSDADDDTFVACALAGKAKVIVSGDHHLQAVSRRLRGSG